MSAARYSNLLGEMGFSEGPDGLWTGPPEPTQDVPNLGAIPGPAGMVVGWVDVEWPSVAIPCRRLRGTIHVPAPLVEDELDGAVEQVLKRRAKALRNCRFCDIANVPGHMHTDDVCQGCSERHLGVVH